MPQDLAEQFEALWESGNSPPDLFAFLEQHNGLDATDKLAVLLQDQQHRWKSDKPLKVEDYLARLPELTSNPDCKLQLAVGEFQARQNGGTSPNVDGFTSRFSDISEELRSKLSELASGTSSGDAADTGGKQSADDPAVEATLTFHSQLTVNDERIGRYRLLRILGEGAFGRVWLGQDEELQRYVAIKVPTPERLRSSEDAETYLSEARTLASLDHPHIVPVHDVGRADDGSVYIVSKFIEGGDLAQCIEEARPAHAESAALIATIAEALQHAHDIRLIHRDIKPANILIEESTQHPYLADFGLAIREENFAKERGKAGSPAYMSPEQARGEGHRLDGRSDIFSLGAVFYELLTGKRPFRGSTINELLHQVVSVDPSQPREIDDSIPAELERICLKALSKRASDRYSTATELADDLLQWQQGPAQETRTLQIVPKGLRSFDADDADFFLDLLPGPRNRDGLPESIQFWKTRIEETDPDKTFSVGLIYGPSGCGKSSLMKAGLLPRLSDDVVAVYVEATPDETETRILRGLRKQLPDLPDDLGLVETLTLLRRGEGRKVVIVLDQFEQWLHAHRAEQETELVSALRQCDGGTLQGVVMVRDDFWLAASRFMNNVEVELLQGQNIGLVDLFDVDHAQKVLTKFGQAFGKLPAQTAGLSDEEREFVTAVAAGLAQDGKVVPVRLAVFGEMVKGKSWVPATLEEVGGTEGIGVNFLEETFSSRTANPKHRLHQQAAREVLKTLLPEVGTDIKGTMQSHDELLEASGYQNRPSDFNDLLRILDGELRLITPTDPEGVQTESGSDPGSKFYQLTHDFLVPSLHKWLTRKQKETRKGRAELKLEERSALWKAKPENRHLPSLLEWASIRTLTDKMRWTEPQRKLMGQAGRVHGVRSTLVLAALGVIVFGGITINSSNEKNRKELIAEKQEDQNDAEATQLVDSLLTADTSQVGTIIENLSGFREWAKDDLTRELADSDDESNAKLHVALAMLPEDNSVLPFLKKRLLSVHPAHFEHVRDLLEAHKGELTGYYWQIIQDSGQESALRFQAACVLASYDPENEHWQDTEFGEFIADHLVNVFPSELLHWRNALRPVQEHLIAPLAAIYTNVNKDVQVHNFATTTLADYLSEDAEGLFDLLADANQKQFGPIFGKLTDHREQAIALGNAEVAKTPAKDASEEDKEALAIHQANATVMLLRMNAPDQVWPLLKHSPDPRLRSYIIHWLGPRSGDPKTIITRYEKETDVTIKRALLLCLGEFDDSRLPESERKLLIETLLTVYRTDPDAGLHAAAEWLLRQWGQAEQIATIDKDLQQNEEQLAVDKDKQRQWYVNGQGQTFVILDAGKFQMGSPESEASRSPDEQLHRRKIGRRFAIATKEVTKAQWREFPKSANVWAADQKQLESYLRTEDSPMLAMTWYEATQYCNWLSEQEGIAEAQWCYEVNAQQKYGPGMKAKENFSELSGYRLPTEAEWEFACRAGANASRYYGQTETLLPKYARFVVNGDSHAWPVGSLKPNDFGLFDMQGNALEWCYDVDGDYPPASKEAAADAPTTNVVSETSSRVLRGGSFATPSSYVRSANRNFNQPSYRDSSIGFRPSRTLLLVPLTPLPPTAEGGRN